MTLRLAYLSFVLGVLVAALAAGCQGTSGAIDASGGSHIDATHTAIDASHTVIDARTGPDGLPQNGVCGGFPGTQCGDAQWCDWMDDSCGGADGTGLCTPRPASCGDLALASCGCDGKIYNNPCEAQRVGVDLASAGGCTPPPGMFTCGSHFCPQGTTYCQKILGGAFGNPGTFNCVTLPAGCGATPSCACVSGETCGTNCTADAQGDPTVSCLTP